MASKIFSSFSLLLLLMISSCKKDPDELIGGKWILKGYTVDATDSLEILKSFFGSDCSLSIDLPPESSDLTGGGISISWGTVNVTTNWYGAGGFFQGLTNDQLTF